MKTAPQDIIDIFGALANVQRLGVLLCLADGRRTHEDLAAALQCPLATAEQARAILTRAGLVVKTGGMALVQGRGAQRRVYALADRITVTDDKLLIDASGLEITIARALKECS